MISSKYNNPAMKQLADQQVKYAPHDVKLAQMDRAEALLTEIDLEQEYQYPEICKQITTYRSEIYPDLMINGSDVMHDVRCFIEDLSESAEIDVEDVEEDVFTVQDLSKKFNISTKTVDRWRDKGLVSRRFRFNGRMRVGFLKSSVDRYLQNNKGHVARSMNFSQLSDEDREEILRRARRLARYGGCPAEISRRIARHMNRSPETIRYTLKNFDRENPELAIFPNAPEKITDQQKRDIYNSFRRGIPVDKLARRYCRTKASIYRIISEARAARLHAQTIDYMHSDEFDQSGAEKVILGPAPEVDKSNEKVRTPPGLPPYLASLYSIPLLTREEEAYYFRKLNFLKYKAAQIQEKLDPNRPKARDMDQIEKLLDESTDVKNFLIRSNLRLVVSIAKRHIRPGGNFFEMVSDGNMSLIRAIEKFDYTKGNKFSTYASWAIMKNYARSIPAEYKVLDRFRTGNDELFFQSTDERESQYREELINQKQHAVIMSILDQLDGREKDILIYRYGLNARNEPQTLEQVGDRFGVTKERIRQLESRALKKLRRITQVERVEIPGI
ncbi:sigma-70 family RNA polymerase sigma factor [Gimesia chilikensis]|jgi:RNA polymerase sigma factor (sigma-70 family)|uniref:RNA polymerase principal sigma factor HrdB n=1 Tax=Gimesia chilikensis TaxID=2605989 RepID=A0A517PXK7_9PLAN|nr:sigma-70 family RNA polymerase sigma factor [Gimesia chilikensis]KAA0140807.1 sigma-70 family RNA polymerase sigma factor [Gimesia chilikensis]QDT24115.1 RNA polymerase principal sigma factor HrdB [Gimesia chilikensis]QDU06169.1 RNA polymerase principal sigma factor HrdB [Gimesia chilikensis]